ncbi:uncharacterized protein LOC142775075 isoform X1 [Rhipicephalus microplus]|uniref:uncharacterized protein LOC142775075 isoform X1 n=1 Tax=Rhipicephalus microplus TaxID=6941 RepID=UPI003F6B2BE6
MRLTMHFTHMHVILPGYSERYPSSRRGPAAACTNSCRIPLTGRILFSAPRPLSRRERVCLRASVLSRACFPRLRTRCLAKPKFACRAVVTTQKNDVPPRARAQRARSAWRAIDALGAFDAFRSFPLACNSVQTQRHAGHALQQHGLALRLVCTSRAAGAKTAANATPVVLQRPAHASPDSHQHTRLPEVASPNHKPNRITERE